MPPSPASLGSENSTTVRAHNKAPRASKPAWMHAVRALDVVLPSVSAHVSFGLFLEPRRFPRPAREEEVLALGRALLVPTDRTVHAREAPLCAWTWGESGPLVLLVHGWQGRGAQLGSFVAPLLTRGMRVVTFDAPAHGVTPGRRSSLFAFRDAVLAMRDAFGPFHAVLSHSMGGAGVLLAADASSAPLATRYAMLCPPCDVRDFTAELTGALGLSERTRSRIHRRLETHFGTSLESLRGPLLAARRHEPLLVVHDADDRDVPLDRGQAIASSWPGAELVVTQGLGHRKILGDRDVIARVVEHLAGS